MSSKKVAKRTMARDCVFKAVYASKLSQTPLNESLEHIMKDYEEKSIDASYAQSLIQSITENYAEIICIIDPAISIRSKANTTDVEMSILTLATAELVYQPDTPAKVVINEAIELAKKYGADEGYKFVNGVLDKVHKSIDGTAS